SSDLVTFQCVTPFHSSPVTHPSLHLFSFCPFFLSPCPSLSQPTSVFSISVFPSFSPPLVHTFILPLSLLSLLPFLRVALSLSLSRSPSLSLSLSSSFPPSLPLFLSPSLTPSPPPLSLSLSLSLSL